MPHNLDYDRINDAILSVKAQIDDIDRRGSFWLNLHEVIDENFDALARKAKKCHDFSDIEEQKMELQADLRKLEKSVMSTKGGSAAGNLSGSKAAEEAAEAQTAHLCPGANSVPTLISHVDKLGKESSTVLQEVHESVELARRKIARTRALLQRYSMDELALSETPNEANRVNTLHALGYSGLRRKALTPEEVEEEIQLMMEEEQEVAAAAEKEAAKTEQIQETASKISASVASVGSAVAAKTTESLKKAGDFAHGLMSSVGSLFKKGPGAGESGGLTGKVMSAMPKKMFGSWW